MPSKKKKYNARFPAGRIKKIMQSDEDIGKVAQAVPIIISRTLELFVDSLLKKTLRVTNSRNAKTLSTSHMKQCIMSENRFDFLKELVRNIPDISVAEEAAGNYNEDEAQSSPEEQYPDSDTPYDLSLPSTSIRTPNGNSAYMRSMSLNGSGLKRQQQQPVANTTSVITQTAVALAQLQGKLPTKLARSESTPAYTNRGRPPSNNALNSRQSYETAIPAPICSYELNKPIVKIDYSNMQASTLGVPEADGDSPTNATYDFAAPVINIDLSNIVSASATTPPNIPTTICFEPLSTSNSNSTVVGTANSNINNDSARVTTTTSINHIAGSIHSPFIPKANAATAPLNEPFFELDEDYDNI